MTKLIVEFVMSEAATYAQTPDAVKARPTASITQLGKCSCGAENFVLASELEADAFKGIRTSRMYECTACGEYRLG